MYRLIDLFAGAGGLTLGFTLTGEFQPVWANDNNAHAARTYNRNFGDHCTTADIVDIVTLKPREIPMADIVIGGPPCQGFSLLNKNRKADARKQLWRPFLEVVKLSKASVFVMENVPQLLGSDEFHEIVDTATAMGFRLVSGKLLAADYGVAQMRFRAFIIGSKKADPAGFFPPPTDGSGWRTVKDAIGDLPSPKGTEVREVPPPLNLHFGRTPTPKSLARYRAIPKEGMNRFDLLRLAPELTPGCWVRKKTGGTDLFGRLWWDRPAFTIRTEFYKPEKGRYLHPKQHRPITHREAARLQSFPDSFTFTGTKIEIAKQIGNAVPPLLARAVATVALEVLRHGSVHKGKAQPDNVRHKKR